MNEVNKEEFLNIHLNNLIHIVPLINRIPHHYPLPSNYFLFAKFYIKICFTIFDVKITDSFLDNENFYDLWFLNAYSKDILLT